MKIGFIGSGHIGRAVATLAIRAGYDVVMSNSRGPETLTTLIAQLGPHASAATAGKAATADRLVVVAIPFGRRDGLPAAALADKIVVDTMNYYPTRDGHISELDSHATTTSELLAAKLPGSRIVKAFNSIYAGEIVSTARPLGDPARRALPIAGDDPEAKSVAAGLIESFGFDVVDVGPLAQGFRFENGTPAYCMHANRSELLSLLADAQLPRRG